MQNQVEKNHRVLITGSAGNFGRLLTKKLLQNPKLEILSVDDRPFENAPQNLQHFELDLRRKSAFELLRKKKPDIIIHLGLIRNPHQHRRKRENAYFFNLETTSQILNLAKNIQVKKLIFLSSANLYGPSANTCGFITEEAPLHGASNNPEFRDLVSIDMMVQSFFWKMPQAKTIILRPCHIIGPHLNNAPMRYFRLETIPYLLGFDPIFQLLYEDDLLECFEKALESNAYGIYNIAGPDTAPLSCILREVGKKTIALPEKFFKALVTTTFFSKKSTFPAAELDHLKYSCLIDTTRARNELKFVPKFRIKQIINKLKESV